jgi:long-subunit fatty acid transport protein
MNFRIRRVCGAVVAGLLSSWAASVVHPCSVANAGELFVPGIGPSSSGRAGAAVASSKDTESIGVNPAGLTGMSGTHISLGSTLLSYSLTFLRNGSYDNVAQRDLPWEGQPYGAVTNQGKPKFGLGSYQGNLFMMIATDFGNVVEGLHGAIGIFAPNGNAVRSMGADYKLDDPNTPPPPSRYDTVQQSSEGSFPSAALAYQLLPNLSLGARFTWAFTAVKSRTFVWGAQNYEEWVGFDTDFTVEAKDNFAPGFGFGVQWAPRPEFELGLQYSSEITFHTVGDAKSIPSKDLDLGVGPIVIGPIDDSRALCAKGGTTVAQKGCVDFKLPQNATIGGRYRFLDRQGKQRGDVEFNLQWENWKAVSDPRVVIDGVVNNTIELKESVIRHHLKDAYSLRLGGSYTLPVANNELTLRAGAAYDTAAAEKGWERVDKDGAARTMFTAGASFQLPHVKIDLGGGFALQGTRNVGGDCNPTKANRGCAGSGADSPIDQRTGWDPVNPILVPMNQVESPVNHGKYTSHYVMMMLGVTASF